MKVFTLFLHMFHHRNEKRCLGGDVDSDTKRGLIGCGGLFALAILLALIARFGTGIGVILLMFAAYLRFGKQWDGSRKPVVAGLICAALLCFGIRYMAYSDERKATREAEASEAESQEELAKLNASLSPGECEEAGMRTYSMMKDMCRRMYPTDSWGDGAGRLSCEAQENKKMDACGAKYMPSI